MRNPNVLASSGSAYGVGWNGHYEKAEAAVRGRTLIILEGGKTKEMPIEEIGREGLGQIVTSATIPRQRTSADNETIVERSEQTSVPDPSIYLG